MMHRLTCALLGMIALAACGRPSRNAADTMLTRGGDVDLRPALRSRELAMFAPLPSVMLAAGVSRTAAQVTLGSRLFHDPALSNGRGVSCNTCHMLDAYGVDGRTVTFGDLGHSGRRNAPSVYNAAGQLAQFWDGRAHAIEAVAEGPIISTPQTAAADSAAVLEHLRASAEYRVMFRDAFREDSEPVTYENVGRAIGAFGRGLVTPGRWDQYLTGDSHALTRDELRGLATFTRVGCVSCHSGAYVGGQMFQKLGRARPWPTATDSGRYLVTHDLKDLFVFKVPSLRNVEKTAPYFHDGSVATLDSAIRMEARYEIGVELTPAQVRDIQTWLSALTAPIPVEYLTNPALGVARR